MSIDATFFDADAILLSGSCVFCELCGFSIFARPHFVGVFFRSILPLRFNILVSVLRLLMLLMLLILFFRADDS